LVRAFIRTLKEECLWQHRFGGIIEEAREEISSWIRYYNMERPHQALKYQIPSEVMALPA